MPKKKNQIRKIVIKSSNSLDSEIPLPILVSYFKQITGDKIYVYKSRRSDDKCTKVKDINISKANLGLFKHFYFTDVDFGNKIDIMTLRCHDVGGFDDIKRDDELLVKLVEEYKTNHPDFKILKVVEIPRSVKWELKEGDCGGGEYIAEKHRIWF